MDVPPVLYNLVFGESVLNDATAIVLFRTLEEFYETPLSWGTVPLMFWRFFVIATGSTVIGQPLKTFVPADGMCFHGISPNHLCSLTVGMCFHGLSPDHLCSLPFPFVMGKEPC